MSRQDFISFRNVCKSYDKKSVVLNDFNLDIEEGSFVSILGSSGSGKSTILNLIAGFIKPESGKILLNGVDIKDVPPFLRPTSTVFQNYALFPHLNVFENIAFGLKNMYTNRENVSDEAWKNIEKSHSDAVGKSKKKISYLNSKMFECMEKAEKMREEIMYCPNGLKRRWKSLMLRNYEARINDLDHWKSHWEYHPILTRNKTVNRCSRRHLRKEEIKERVERIISLVGLEGKEHKKHTNLSGGQQQRIALARSLIMEPQILLLDEPLSALDEEVREKLQLELKRLHKQLKITFILVTHNQKEALVLSDKIVVLRKGNIEQIGTPSELYDSPSNRWVASFMGKANIFSGTYLRPGVILVGDKEFLTDVREGFEENESVYVMIRPEDYDVVAEEEGIVAVTVIDSIYKGQLWELKCQFLEEIIYVENIDEVAIGSRVGLVWDSMDVHVMKN